MARFLIVYASTHGHTGRIVERVGTTLGTAGHDVVIDDRPGESGPCLHDYDAVIVGASIHSGHHQHEMIDWARHHAVALNMTPAAFFSVCLTAAEDDEQARATACTYLDDFEDRTGWLPRLRTSFAGALQYGEYGFSTRLAMRVLMHRGGHPSDVTRDHDFTDWAAVDEFAVRCSALVPAPVAG